MNKQDWTYKKLGEVATFLNGYPFKPTDWKDNGRKIIRIQNLNNPNAAYNFYDGSIDPKYLVSNGDVLISWSGSLGVFEWTEDEAILNQHIFKVVFNKGHINKRFFEYVVASRINEMKSKVHGVTMQHITKKEFDVILIPVPPIAEQERIVAELDLLQGIIEKKKEQLKAYDQLAQSIFYTMFGDPIDNEKGWETKPLGELCSVITKGTTPTTLGFPFVEEGINFVKVESFIDGRIDSSKLSHITHECNLALSRSKLEDKDLLVCIAGATIGKMAVVDSSILPANTNQACAILRFKDKSIISYIQSFLELKFDYDVMQMGKGVAQPNLSLGQLRNLFIPMPPIGQRETYTTILEAIERQKALVQQSIDETQTMFDYTMDKYFG